MADWRRERYFPLGPNRCGQDDSREREEATVEAIGDDAAAPFSLARQIADGLTHGRFRLRSTQAELNTHCLRASLGFAGLKDRVTCRAYRMA